MSQRREGVVVEKADQLATSGAQAGVALDGRLPATRDEDFEFVRWIIERPGAGDSENFRLVRLGGNENGDAR